jgi:phosphohistidine phosphatase
MLTLSLLRHAKSSWSDARLRDIERPLNERGELTAPRVGAFMAKRGLVPDLVLCSTAVRARQTLDLVLRRLKGGEEGSKEAAPEVVYEDALYLASLAAMLKRVRKVAAKVRHVLIVGHNPGLQSLALELAGSGPAEELEALAEKFPTGGLAVIAFAGRGWSKIKPGAGRLELFMVPKRLP